MKNVCVNAGTCIDNSKKNVIKLRFGNTLFQASSATTKLKHKNIDYARNIYNRSILRFTNPFGALNIPNRVNIPTLIDNFDNNYPLAFRESQFSLLLFRISTRVRCTVLIIFILSPCLNHAYSRV